MSAKEEFTCSSKPALDSGALYHTNHLPWAMAMLLAEIDLLFISHNRLGLYKWDGLSLDALDNDSIQQVSILQGHLIISQFLVGERHEKAEGWSLVFRSCPTYLQSQGTAQMAYQQKCYEQCQLKDTPQCTCASLQPYDCGSAVPPIWKCTQSVRLIPFWRPVKLHPDTLLQSSLRTTLHNKCFKNETTSFKPRM